jgi:hypothetical protein
MKIIILVLRMMLIIPIGLGIWHLFWPDKMSELINLVIGLPILIVNMWAWQAPELLRELIFGKAKPKNDDWSV